VKEPISVIWHVNFAMSVTLVYLHKSVQDFSALVKKKNKKTFAFVRYLQTDKFTFQQTRQQKWNNWQIKSDWNSNVQNAVVTPRSLLKIIVQWSIQIIMFCDFGLWQDPWTGRQYSLRSHCVSSPTVPKNTLRISKTVTSVSVLIVNTSLLGTRKKCILEKKNWSYE
jgi:hypothetical protein